MEERWINVVGYEGYYQVSDHGNVRTVPRVIIRTGRNEGVSHTVRSKILKPWPQGRYKHMFVGLYRERGMMKVKAVHRIVLEAFVGPCPPGMQCCHWDGDTSNNRVENLRWDTPKNNQADRERHGRHDKGSECVKAKLTEDDIPAIRSFKTDRRGVMSAVARNYGVDPATIRDIWVGKTWGHVP